MKDIDIIRLYFSRSEKAIEETQRKYEGYCTAIADNILHSKQDSEECVNDTYLKVWETVPPRKPENFRTYLGRITRNLAINRYKSYTAQKRGGCTVDVVISELEGCIPSGASVEKQMDEKLIVALLEDFLKQQSDTKRSIFLRRYWYCEAISQIAEDFSVSESKVTSILYRMRLKLKEKLEKEGISV